MEHILIVNRTAGSVNNKLEDTIDSVFSQTEYKVIYINEESDITDTVRMYANKEGTYYIYSCGGDGTVNRIVNGMVGSNKLLGIIPLGSGNDFDRTLSKTKGATSIDVGKVTYNGNIRYFVNEVDIGLTANAAYEADKLKGSVPNKLIYVFGAIKAIKDFNIPTIYYSGEKDPVPSIVVSNGKYFGNKMKIAPDASINDGKLDITIPEFKNKIEAAFLFPELLAGIKFKAIRKQESSLKVCVIGNAWLDIDGDPVYLDKLANHIEFETVPNAIQVLGETKELNELRKLLKR